MKRIPVCCASAASLALLALSPDLFTPSQARPGESDSLFPNPSGMARTVVADGRRIDTSNPFFQVLGTNGRACVTCHQPGDGWGVSAADIRARFDATGGTDPIFRTVDGANSPDADVSTVEARRQAYSMLLSRGVIRVGIGIPADAEFELAAVDDPYGHASASELSLFRRPLPATNLRFLTAIMWDGREPNFAHQANDATLGHAQGARDLTSEQQQQIVDFETSLYTAQAFDNGAGPLNARHARGGARDLAAEPFYIGMNDLLGDSMTGAPFDNDAITLYRPWANEPEDQPFGGARRAIARGEALFNNKEIDVTGVKGLNDNPAFGSPAVVQATCSSCHDTPNVGNHSVALALDIGLTDASRRTPDLPLYTLRSKQTGETIQTTDPGRALITGKWADIGKFKGPILRGLAARAPYFHNGSAADLGAVLDFYQSRFGVTFTPQERSDLIAFLKSL